MTAEIRVQTWFSSKTHVCLEILAQTVSVCGNWGRFEHHGEVLDLSPIQKKKKKESFECAALSCLPLQRSEDEDSSGWRGFLSSMGLSIPATLCRLAPPALRLNRRRMLQGKAPDIPEHVLRLAGVGPDRLRAEWSFPAFIAMFLPEFPHKAVPGHEHFQVNLTSTTKLTDLEKAFIIFPQSHDIFWFGFFIFYFFML